eukprot:TRINITY_DN4526_c0_g1_i1.p1 TRINITY_DN4526_c0_g1~~TRINITY_DN4526_c0_g1_i1.p1  ORF type:complete len:275 (-),score=43.36 TRINITY_DN4526_c0_g1_i1:50-814(-)
MVSSTMVARIRVGRAAVADLAQNRERMAMIVRRAGLMRVELGSQPFEEGKVTMAPHPWFVVCLTQDVGDVVARIQGEFTNNGVIGTLFVAIAIALLAEPPFGTNDSAAFIVFVYANTLSLCIFMVIVMLAMSLMFQVNHMCDEEDVCWFVATQMSKHLSAPSYSDLQAGLLGLAIACEMAACSCIVYEKVPTPHSIVLISLIGLSMILFLVLNMRLDQGKWARVNEDFTTILKAYQSFSEGGVPKSDTLELVDT